MRFMTEMWDDLRAQKLTTMRINATHLENSASFIERAPSETEIAILAGDRRRAATSLALLLEVFEAGARLVASARRAAPLSEPPNDGSAPFDRDATRSR